MAVIRAVVTPIATALAVVASAGTAIRVPVDLSASQVATALRDRIEGTGRKWAWEGFTSMPIEDPALEAIRLKAAELNTPVDDTELRTLRELLNEAEALAATEAGT